MIRIETSHKPFAFPDHDKVSTVYDHVTVRVTHELKDRLSIFADKVKREIPVRKTHSTGHGIQFGTWYYSFRARSTYTRYLVQRIKNCFKNQPVTQVRT